MTTPPPPLEFAVRRAIALFLGHAEDALAWDAPLADAVGDSFALVDLAVHLQQEFAVRLAHEDLAQAATAADLAVLVAARRDGSPADAAPADGALGTKRPPA